MSAITPQIIQTALTWPAFDVVTAQAKMAPHPRPVTRPLELSGAARMGGVLLLCYEAQGVLHVPFVQRPIHLRNHPGQISLPGGKQEPGEALMDTAVRETHEEIGIPPEKITLLGALSPIYIPPSDFYVHPFVAWHDGRPTFICQPEEVAHVLEVPVKALQDPTNHYLEERPWGTGHTLQVPYFGVDGDKIWGATAAIMSEFISRLALATAM